MLAVEFFAFHSQKFFNLSKTHQDYFVHKSKKLTFYLSTIEIS
tara:strand:+ start:138125 stop:138253 length:129 start_codon:yes stop_codon:yes gene_type:complete